MNSQDCYEVTGGESLLQGDILANCPVFSVSDRLLWPLAANAEIEVEAKLFDLMVMTQSCELEDEKGEDILLAQLVSWTDVVHTEVARGNQGVRSRKFRKLLVDGNVPGLSLLHKRPSSPGLPWSVLDFHRLLTLSLQRWCKHRRSWASVPSPISVTASAAPSRCPLSHDLFRLQHNLLPLAVERIPRG
jgi:hypothetical protein